MSRTCALAALSLASVLTFSPVLATAQPTVVVGTNNPDIDVAAVQAAVNLGGEVILKGRFSFDATPTVLTALQGGGYARATVLISREVAISGVRADEDEMTSINGGTIPFYVEAPGAHVTIQGLRYTRPKTAAVFVYAASGLVITFCRIDGVEPQPHLASNGIAVLTSALPMFTNPGTPGNLAGPLLITNNDIDMAGGTAADNTLGIVVFSAGQTADNGVDVYVSGNRISHVTEPAIDVRRIGGTAHVEGNVVTTGNVVSTVNPGPEVIRVANIGSYVIAHNSIHCEWPDPLAKGITVFSQIPQWPMQRAIVADNEVVMSAAPDTVFGDSSAGIDIRGFATANIVTHNSIRGRARAALLLEVFKGGVPDRNELVLNRFDGFDASDADIVVSSGVSNTRIVGRGTRDDQGTGTVVVSLPSVRWIR
jgi:hypothetical protein